MSDTEKLRAPSYRRHKPSGRAVVTINGRDRYLGKHRTADSQRSYDRLIAEWLSNGRQFPRSDSAEITVNELMASYLKFAAIYSRETGPPTKELSAIK